VQASGGTGIAAEGSNSGPAPDHAGDDREALARVRATVASPEYRIADHDVDFLQHDATRGLRLQLDYLKAEMELARHGIGHMIVVFGSSRVAEPAVARRRLSALRIRSAAAPGDAALGHEVRIAERLLANSHYYEIAREFARRVGASADRPHGDRVAIMTGGGPGLMEAANRGAWDAGARSVGLNISLPREQAPNPYVTRGLCLQFHYFAIRKLHFLHRARALVAFPGGYGTMDELFETLTLIQTRKIDPLPVVLVGGAFWSRAIDFSFLVDEGVVSAEDLGLFRIVETAAEIHRHIAEWHASQGRRLLDGSTAGA
jgi:uncharacterized protein (TIGR00730 family)